MITKYKTDEISVLWERWALLFEEEYLFCKEYGADEYIDESIALFAPHSTLFGDALSRIFDESFRWREILDLIKDVHAARLFLPHMSSVIDRTLKAIEKLYEVEDIVSDEYLDYADKIKEEYLIAKQILRYYSQEALSNEEVDNRLQQVYDIANGKCINVTYAVFVDCIKRGYYLEAVNLGQYYDPNIEENVYDIIPVEVGLIPVPEHLFSFWISLWVCLCITTDDKPAVEIRTEVGCLASKPKVNWVEASLKGVHLDISHVGEDDKEMLSSLTGRLTFEDIVHDIQIQDFFNPSMEEELNYYTILGNFNVRLTKNSLKWEKVCTLLHEETLYLESHHKLLERCFTCSCFTDMEEKHRRNSQDWRKSDYDFIHRWYIGKLEEDEWFNVYMHYREGVAGTLKEIEELREHAEAVGYPVLTDEMMHQYISRCIKSNYEFMNAIRNIILIYSCGLSTERRLKNEEAFQMALDKNFIDASGRVKQGCQRALANMLVSEGYVDFKYQKTWEYTKSVLNKNTIQLSSAARKEILANLNFNGLEGLFQASPKDLRHSFVNQDDRSIDSMIIKGYL